MKGLLYYLFTEGVAGEKGLSSDHTAARVIAGWDPHTAPAVLQPPRGPDGRRDFTDLAGQLNAPLAALGPDSPGRLAGKPVYHLAIAAAKDDAGRMLDRELTDVQWADIAREYMHRLGLAGRGEDTGVRWVAVRHAPDHVHVVATLARQDGRRPRLFNDRYRAMQASRAVETRYGLVATLANGRTGPPSASRAEQRKHTGTVTRRRSEGRSVPAAPDRDELRRQVRVAAAGAVGTEQFFARLAADGMLVRKRYSEQHPGEVTGYAVALADRFGGGGEPVFFGGGKLASDLSLPQLRRRWQDGDDNPGRQPVTGGQRTPDPAGRPAVWSQALHAAGTAAAAVDAAVAAGPRARSEAGDMAWAASDVLAAAARLVEGRRGGPLTRAADGYDLAARETNRRVPPPTTTGRRLRSGGRGLLSLRAARGDENRQVRMLVHQLAALARATARLRQAQDRAEQARHALGAAEALERYGGGPPRTVVSGGPSSAKQRPPQPRQGRRATAPSDGLTSR